MRFHTSEEMTYLGFSTHVSCFVLQVYCIQQTAVYMFSLNQTLNIFIWFFLGTWVIQGIVSLACEWKADVYATSSIKIPADLKEVEKSLYRMTSQAIKRLPQPIGWIRYVYSMLFLDPHPPFVIRRWLLRRRFYFLMKNNKEHVI